MESLFEKIIYHNYSFPSLLNDKTGLKHLYSLLMKANTYCENINVTVHRNLNHPVVPNKNDSKYFPTDIQNLIIETHDTYTRIELKTPKRDITLDFVYIKGNPDCVPSLSKLVLWFSLLDLISPDDNVNKSLHVMIYLTKERKRMPRHASTPINASHINSALTNICQKRGKITIFREEEWLKVLLHECIHSYCLDFSQYDQSEMDNCLKKLLPIDIKNPHYSETYAEIWAEIMNIALITFTSNNWLRFSLQFEFYLQLEVVFSISRSNMLLSKENLSFATLREKMYLIQDTHMYEYFILKTILLSSCGDFLIWCLKENGKMMVPFKEKNIEKFCQLVKQSYLKTDFMVIVKAVGDKYATDSLRMSICE